MIRKIFLAFFLLTETLSFSQNSPTLKLWYNQPSGKTWENALPIGNGRLGAMVYGNVEKETLQLNEPTVWSGSPNRNDNPDALAALLEIRQLIFDGKQKEALRVELGSWLLGSKISKTNRFCCASMQGEDYSFHFRIEAK